MKNESSEKVAGRIFSSEDYQSSDEVSKGLATTHEQATDSLTEGTIDGVMENVKGKDISLKKKQ